LLKHFLFANRFFNYLFFWFFLIIKITSLCIRFTIKITTFWINICFTLTFRISFIIIVLIFFFNLIQLCLYEWSGLEQLFLELLLLHLTELYRSSHILFILIHFSFNRLSYFLLLGDFFLLFWFFFVIFLSSRIFFFFIVKMFCFYHLFFTFCYFINNRFILLFWIFFFFLRE